MTNLIDTLRKETTSLKIQYIEFTSNYAKNHFDKITKLIKLSEQELYDIYNIKYQMEKCQYGSGIYAVVDSSEYRKKTLYKMRDDIQHFKNIVRDGFDKFLAKEIKFAEDHYEASLIKLANRIESKELNTEKLTVSHSHIGINIDLYITDGVNNVHAFTIIAHGPIQRPHYRYLIK